MLMGYTVAGAVYPHGTPAVSARSLDTLESLCLYEAGDRARTGDIQLGRLTLYQLSYTRASSECTKRRVRDDVR